MPNWCSTTICLYGNDDDKQEIYEAIKEIEKEKHVVTEQDIREYFCIYGTNFGRGSIEDFWLDSQGLYICQEDAWNENTDYWEKIIKEKGYNLSIAYRAECFEDDMFYIYDETGKIFTEKYILNLILSENDKKKFKCKYQDIYEYFSSDESLINYFNDAFGVDCKSIEETEKYIKKINSTDYSSANLKKFEKGE